MSDKANAALLFLQPRYCHAENKVPILRSGPKLKTINHETEPIAMLGYTVSEGNAVTMMGNRGNAGAMQWEMSSRRR